MNKDFSIENIIESETINFNTNVLEDINKIIREMPNTTLIEKLRYIYIKLGNLFNFDYSFAYNLEHENEEIDLNNYVSKYQYCYTISYILNEILNKIAGIESEIIARDLKDIRGKAPHEHYANKVTIINEFGDKESYLLDLSLDLYLIQANFKTKHFGFETSLFYDINDIIPQVDNKEMDIKLGLSDGSYLDDKIKIIKNKVKNLNLSLTDKINIINKLLPKYNGYHEGKQFITLMFIEFDITYKEYNIYKLNDNNLINFKSIFKIQNNDGFDWFIYTSNYGLVNISLENIKNLINNNWLTKSDSLYNELENVISK